MIVHRFMSKKEYDSLLKGHTVHNKKAHGKSSKTDSVGFCFFTENPDDAVHWLSGIVDMDFLVTFEVDESLLSKSYGVYRNTKGEGNVKRDEYCTKAYSTKDFHILSATDKYVSMYPPREVQKAFLALLGLT